MKKLRNKLSVVSMFLLISTLFITVLTGCNKNKTKGKVFTSLDDFSEANIAEVTGSVLSDKLKLTYPNVNIKYYNDNASLCAALRKGDVEAIIGDEPVAENIASINEDFDIFPEKFVDDEYGILFAKGDTRCDAFSEKISEYYENGFINEMHDKWFNADHSKRVLDRSAYAINDPSAPTIRVAFDATGQEPMVYLGEDGEPIGYETEIVYKVCSELHYNLKFIPMSFATVVAAVETGKADITYGSLSMSEERKQKFDFTVPTYYGGIVLLCRKTSIGIYDDPDLNSPTRTIAIQDTTIPGIEAQKRYPNAKFIFCNDETSGILLVKTGKADAYALDINYFESRKRTGKDDLRIHSDGIIGTGGDVAVAISRKTTIANAEVRLNAFIKQVREDGTIDDMLERWTVKCDYKIPDIPEPTDPTETFIVGTSGLSEPYTFIQDNEPTGFEVELAKRFGAFCNAKIIFATYDWSALDAAASAGKVDFVFSNYYVTPEKEEVMDFSIPYLTCRTIMAVNNENEDVGGQTFFDKVKQSFERTFIRENRWKLIANGILVTIEITLFSALLGTLIGFFLFLLCEKRKTANKVVKTISRILENIPSLVVLMIFYFIIFGDAEISPIFVGVLAFGLLFGFSVLGLLSAGVQAINFGQRESATALGMNRTQVYSKILIPQIIRLQLPIYKSELVGLLKQTAVIGYISVIDLTKASDIIRSRTFEAFFPLIVSAIIYFGLAHLIFFLVNRVNVHIDPQRHNGRLPRGIKDKEYTPTTVTSEVSGEKKDLIILEDVVKSFPSSTPLRHITTTVHSGDVISIIGPSGTGKSTLLRLMNGLETPTTGSITVLGEDICAPKANLSAVREKVGMVFQNYSLFDHLNVIENLMLAPMLLKHVSAQEAYNDGMTLLKSVGMAERALQMPSQLSGGQRQRVAIARTMAMHPEVILFDEPTSALDPKNIGEVLSVIRQFSTDTTMVIVTHELGFAKTVANRVWYMDQGGIYEDGTPDQIFNHPEHNRTHAFVNKMNVLPLKIDINGYDQIETFEAISQYCLKHFFGDEKEKLILNIFKNVIDEIDERVSVDDSHITFLIEYSEEPSKTEIKFFFGKEECKDNLLEDVKSDLIVSSDITFVDNQNLLTIILK